MDSTRRQWALSTFAAFQHASHPAAPPTTLRYLSPATAADLEALASTIIPSEPDSPGAVEAGFRFFLDHALLSWDQDKRQPYTQGLAHLNQLRLQLFPNSTFIADLSPQQRTQLLTAIDRSPFFELLRTHTILSFLGPPSYHGNRDYLGYRHIHVEPAMIFSPPFGYYDDPANNNNPK